MIEINLVPDVKQELIKAQRIRATVIAGSILIGIVSIGVVALLAFYVFAVQTVRGSLIDGQIASGSKKLSSVEDLQKILTIQNQLTKISNLNANRKIDSRLFDVLAKIIPPEPNSIKVSSLKVDADAGSISIDGQAANSYAALEVFKKTILATVIKYKDSDNKEQSVKLGDKISTKDVSYGEDSSGTKVLRFTLSFVYAPELFSPASKDLSLAVIIDSAGNGNVSDSYIGIPKSIFTNKAKDIEEDK